jgi:hypothetical protein
MAASIFITPFLDTLSNLAYKATLPGFGKLVKAEEESSHGFQSQDAAEDQDSSHDRRQIPSRQGRKGRDSGGKKVAD